MGCNLSAGRKVMSSPLPTGLEIRTTMSRNSPVAGLGMRARTATCSSPRPSVAGMRRRTMSRNSSAFRFEWRPDIQEYSVPIQPLLGTTPRLKQADRGESFHEHAFQMRQLNDATGFVAHRSYVADFGGSEQAFIFRVVAGNGVQKIDVFD